MFVSAQEQSLNNRSCGFEFGACGFPSRRLQQIAAAGHGNQRGADHLKYAERRKYFEQAVDLIDGPRDFDDERFGSHINDPRAENFDQFHQVGAILLIGRDFDQGKVSLEKRTSGDIFCKENIDELFEAGFEAMRTSFIGMRHDGHAGNFFILGWADRERIYIDGQAPSKRRDTVEDAGFVFDIGDKCLHVCLDFSYGSVAVSTSGLFGRRIISLKEAPAATMGYTESSCSTRKSISTVSADSPAERMVGTTSARLAMPSPRMPKALT